MLKIPLILQARMGSTRLPGKVLLPVLGRPLLSYEIERLQKVSKGGPLIVATTERPDDDPIEQLCNEMQVSVFRGSSENVRDRYLQAAETVSADAVVRVTADCPLIDPEVVDAVIQAYVDDYPEIDYVSNTLKRTYPRGMDVEVFSFPRFKEIIEQTSSHREQEHVTPFFYRHPKKYRLKNVGYHEKQSHHRWTVDTPEDYTLIKKVLEEIYPVNPNFTMEDLLILMKRHPEWEAINAHVEQKKWDAE